MHLSKKDMERPWTIFIYHSSGKALPPIVMYYYNLDLECPPKMPSMPSVGLRLLGYTQEEGCLVAFSPPFTPQPQGE